MHQITQISAPPYVAAAVPMIVRWRTDALEKDYAEVHNKTAVIAFSIVLQSAAAITSFLGLMVSAFNRMEVNERDLSFHEDDSSFWNSEKSRQSSTREALNGDESQGGTLNNSDVRSEMVLQVKAMKQEIGTGTGTEKIIWRNSKTSSRHSC